MRSFLNATLLLLLVCGAVLGCAAATQENGPVVGGADSDATLVVDNQSTSDMRIYAIISGGQRVRLGSVSGLSTQRLSIPRHVIGGGRDVAFEADPLAGQSSATSFNIYVAPGQEVTIRIPSRLR